MTTADFPILDAPRTTANDELGRQVLDSLGNLEPYIEETDCWIALPLRLVHDQANDLHLEAGPYSLARADIELLRLAIATYDRATGRSVTGGGGR